MQYPISLNAKNIYSISWITDPSEWVYFWRRKMEPKKLLFPFTSIVGQEKMKKALLLNIIDPSISGVLIKGEKGTAKSTMVRSLIQILPERKVVMGCVFNCNPDNTEMMCQCCQEKISKGIALKEEFVPMNVVELPLSSTEDRVAGTLDLEHVLKTGEKKFEPGVLAQANNNLLYVDEVNLLDDHIVDLLLDSAAMGVNYVEREGVSFSHPSRFILVGTMNPEEGDLRPQLLDRFGLSVDVKSEKEIDERIEIVKRRLLFDQDPEKYIESCNSELIQMTQKITSARRILKNIFADDDILQMIVKTTTHFGIDGHRADITLMKASKANAAFQGRNYVTKADIKETAPLVLMHRMRRRPFEESILDMEELDECLQSL